MTMKANVSLWLLLALLLQAPCRAVGQTADSATPADSLLSHPYLGVELQLPDGWEAQVGPTGFLLSHDSLGGFVAVIPHNHASLDEVRKAARTGLREEPGVILTAQDDLSAWSTNGLAGPFTGTAEGNAVQAYGIFLLSPHSGGVTVLAAAMADVAVSDARRAAESIASGLRFLPKLRAAVLPPWEERLTNCRLLHFPERSPGSDPETAPAGPRVVLDLCADRSFSLWLPGPEHLAAWTGQSVWPAPTAAGSAVFQGTWSLLEQDGGAVLRLVFRPAATKDFSLTFPDGSTYLNDLHVFRSYSDALRAEDVPSCP